MTTQSERTIPHRGSSKQEITEHETTKRGGTHPATVHPDPIATAGAWVIDIARTTAAFEVSELGLRTVRGTVPVTEAGAEFDASGALRWVSAELDPARVSTGNPKRDSDLQGARFFATESHPRWTFRGRAAVPVDGGWTVPGQLTVRDQTNVSLDVRPAADQSDPDLRTLVATTELDRRDAGLRKAPGVVIGHRIRVTITVVLRRIG